MVATVVQHVNNILKDTIFTVLTFSHLVIWVLNGSPNSGILSSYSIYREKEQDVWEEVQRERKNVPRGLPTMGRRMSLQLQNVAEKMK